MNTIISTSNFVKIPKYRYTKQAGTSTYAPNSDLIFKSEKFRTIIRISKEHMKLGVPTNLAEYLQEYLYKTAGISGRFSRPECDAIFLEAALIGNLGFTGGMPSRRRNSVTSKIHAYFTYIILRCCGGRHWQYTS